MVNLGTGIGGGIVYDGQVIRGRYGIAGEFAHMQVVPDGIRCECGNRGCWEQYASGNALVREARVLMASTSPMITDLFREVVGSADTLSGPLVTEAASDSNDPAPPPRVRSRGRPLESQYAGSLDQRAKTSMTAPKVFACGRGLPTERHSRTSLR